MTKPKYLVGLGFRDIEMFHLALLAKQAWRILQQPGSLSARILKSVYFQNKQFLDADLGSSPSRIWRSILEGRDCLNKGLIRRIGNGESTDLWNMNWLPMSGYPRPIKTEQANHLRWVSKIINQSEARWDTEKIQQLFTPADAEAILSIPLSTRNQSDFWAWHHEKKGIFTVRSAYRMLVSMREQTNQYEDGIAGRSDTNKVEKEWTTLWGLLLPSKLKIFLWRLARQSLPTGDVLHHRNMALQALCALCGDHDSWKHSLLECNMAKCVWALEKEDITEHICQIQETKAKNWLLDIIESLPHEGVIRVVVSLWAIWYARRKAIYENIFQSPLSTHCFISKFI
jgi:hypothetical protein